MLLQCVVSHTNTEISHVLLASQMCDARIGIALPAEMFETFPSGGSMHASVKLEEIDGRAPQERVEHVA